MDVLNACDVIVCEDSRVTGKLLKAYGISVPKKIIYNDHVDEVTQTYILTLLKEGKIVTLVSDAGTPLISDPGYKLVRDCIQEGLKVIALPGANAVLPALQLSGLPTDSFTFCGFLPSKEQGVRSSMAHYSHCPETVIFYDSPNRIEKTLNIINEIIPNRQIAVVREISKLYEESLCGFASEILLKIIQKPLKGEIVLVIKGAEKSDDIIDIDSMIIDELKRHISVKELSQNLSLKTGLKKKDIYSRALELQKK